MERWLLIFLLAAIGLAAVVFPPSWAGPIPGAGQAMAWQAGTSPPTFTIGDTIPTPTPAAHAYLPYITGPNLLYRNFITFVSR